MLCDIMVQYCVMIDWVIGRFHYIIHSMPQKFFQFLEENFKESSPLAMDVVELTCTSLAVQ